MNRYPECSDPNSQHSSSYSLLRIYRLPLSPTLLQDTICFTGEQDHWGGVWMSRGKALLALLEVGRRKFRNLECLDELRMPTRRVGDDKKSVERVGDWVPACAKSPCWTKARFVSYFFTTPRSSRSPNSPRRQEPNKLVLCFFTTPRPQPFSLTSHHLHNERRVISSVKWRNKTSIKSK